MDNYRLLGDSVGNYLNFEEEEGHRVVYPNPLHPLQLMGWWALKFA